MGKNFEHKPSYSAQPIDKKIQKERFSNGKPQYNNSKFSYNNGKSYNRDNQYNSHNSYGSQQQHFVSKDPAVNEFLTSHEIKIYGGDVNVYLKFEDTPFSSQIKKALQNAGYEKPTPIQATSWPVVLSGKDCLAIAKTGSGKTCGFLLPAINHILHKKKTQTQKNQGPIALVVAPTRELCQQIAEEANKFCGTVGIKCAVIYGGADKGPQIGQLERNNPDLVVATPGRLLDFLQMKSFRSGELITNLNSTSMLVLDEADKMLDMGFEKDILRIVDYIPIENQKQTLFYTATWPKNVQKIAFSILKSPIEIKIGNTSNKFAANKDVIQEIRHVRETDKYDELKKHLKTLQKGQRLLIFSNKKYTCMNFEQQLWREGFTVGSIHGDKVQFEREQVLNDFKSGKTPILLATDVCGRGIDIKDVDVMNLDFPKEISDYIHRIGRSGRAGEKGSAISFFTEENHKCAKDLVKILLEAGQEVDSQLKLIADNFVKFNKFSGKFNGYQKQGGYHRPRY